MKKAITSIRAIQCANRGTSAYNMLSTVADGAIMLAWVTAEARPWKLVDDSLLSAQYFGNIVLKAEPQK